MLDSSITSNLDSVALAIIVVLIIILGGAVKIYQIYVSGKNSNFDEIKKDMSSMSDNIQTMMNSQVNSAKEHERVIETQNSISNNLTNTAHILERLMEEQKAHTTLINKSMERNATITELLNNLYNAVTNVNSGITRIESRINQKEVRQG
tara:strand:- start:9001 stop:9450 length:450 start_codon:yes stop_codon:yes gene_type:complete